MSLTPKQKRVLDFVEAYFAEQGLMPSRREIAEGLGLSSVATVQEHIEALEKNGYLKRGSEGSARAFSLASITTTTTITTTTGGAGSSVSGPDSRSESRSETNEREIPLLGRVAAGFPIEVFSQQRVLPIPATLFGITTAPHFALEVQGDSMRDDGILEGDLVILEKKSTARSGETVVALWNGEATLKRYVRGNRKEGEATLELHPANPKYPVLKVQPDDRFEIQGVLRGVIRTYGKSNGSKSLAH